MLDLLKAPLVIAGIWFPELSGNACLSSPFLLPEPLKLPQLGRLHSSPAHRPAYPLVPQRADTNEQDSSCSFPWIKKSLRLCGPLAPRLALFLPLSLALAKPPHHS